MVWNLSQLRSSIETLLMFQIGISGETMRISLPAFSTPALPLHFFLFPSKFLYLPFSLGVSLLCLLTPTHAFSL